MKKVAKSIKEWKVHDLRIGNYYLKKMTAATKISWNRFPI